MALQGGGAGHRHRRPGRQLSGGGPSTAVNGNDTSSTLPQEKSKSKKSATPTSMRSLFARFFVLAILFGFVLLIIGSKHEDQANTGKIPESFKKEIGRTSDKKNAALDGNSNPEFEDSVAKEAMSKGYKRRRKIVTAVQEPPTTLQSDVHPLPRRATSQSVLKATEFPQIQQSCSTWMQDFGRIVVNSFFANSTDPWLPWIHDYFISPNDNTRVVFVSQNRRNCDTGKGMEQIMEFWKPQIALFQPVPVVRTDYVNGTSSFRLFGDGPDPEQFTATKNSDASIMRESIVPETRFICRFHWRDGHEEETDKMQDSSSITLSEFPFNYEYVSWRKREAMYKEGLLTRSAFWNSQLMFSCPIPAAFQATRKNGGQLLVDIIPIRTPPRSEQVFVTSKMVGHELYQQMQSSSSFFNVEKEFSSNHFLPALADSGRWANLPICENSGPKQPDNKQKKPYRLVACTWTSASYHRRGEDEDQPLSDNTLRLREWLLFHRMVGFDHVIIYDNSPLLNYSESPLFTLVQEFDSSFVTHQPWTPTICNNNKPMNKHPGDRSSQYAAEASCRERFGPLTDWMAFIDTDEYLTPTMRDPSTDEPYTWKPILDYMEKRDVAIMKFKSGRNLPRVHLMDPLEDQDACGDPITAPFLKEYKPEPCLVPRRNETFLKVYNCDSVKLPRPERFSRAMKQIYRPDYVFSHFVHYSTVTEYSARYNDPKRPITALHSKFDPDKELFLDELNEGTLIHARSVVPRDTMFRSRICQVLYPRMTCFLGYECPESVEWIDDKGRAEGARTKKFLNPHQDPEGNFCSCWVNNYVDNVWVPKLEKEIAYHIGVTKL